MISLSLLLMLPATGVDVVEALDQRRQIVFSQLKSDEDVPASVRELVQRSLVAEARKLRNLVVFSGAEIASVLDLEAEKQTLGCADAECLTEIGDALGSDELAVTTLASVGDSWVFGLRRLDVRTAKSVADATVRVPAGDAEAMLAQIGSLVEQAFPGFELKEGQTRGVPPETAASLYPPPVPPMVTWSTYAATGGAAVLSVVAGGLWALEQGAIRGLTGTVDGLALRSRRDQATAAYATMWVGAGTAAALGVTALVLTPLTDWGASAE